MRLDEKISEIIAGVPEAAWDTVPPNLAAQTTYNGMTSTDMAIHHLASAIEKLAAAISKEPTE